jgi:bis(5'-nucleosyl)-tetraphosphatase (symmetrical)
MATYAIGDIQGCYATLQGLLARIGFDAARDRLWLVGDLVNRGPRSLDVLRWARALDGRIVAVLGNHDLHLLGRAAGVRPRRDFDTFDDILQAPDRDPLLEWLAARPLLYREGDRVLVHAGLLPAWTVDDAEARARAAEAALRTGGPAALAGSPDMAALTRVRLVDGAGEPVPDYSGPLDGAPPGTMPWFAHPARRSRGSRIVFGHWAALGLVLDDDAVGLDTGCVWGRCLTAMRLEDGAVFSEPTAMEDRR